MNRVISHPKEKAVLSYLDKISVLKPPIRVDSCTTITDVKKFVKSSKTILKHKPSQRQYNHVIHLCRLIRDRATP